MLNTTKAYVKWVKNKPNLVVSSTNIEKILPCDQQFETCAQIKERAMNNNRNITIFEGFCSGFFQNKGVLIGINKHFKRISRQAFCKKSKKGNEIDVATRIHLNTRTHILFVRKLCKNHEARIFVMFKFMHKITLTTLKN